MASWSTALRHTSTRRRPLSLQYPNTTSTSVRWASIVPYSINEHSYYSPPPPPMTPEQVQQQALQKQLLQHSKDTETSQRWRLQQELQLQLAKHRNAILEQQQQRQRQLELEKQAAKDQLKQEQELAQQQQQQQNTDSNHGPKPITAASSTSKEEEGTNNKVKGEKVDNTLANNNNNNNNNDLENCSPEASATSRRQFIPTRHRSMFGYRGPEHKTLIELERQQQQQQGQMNVVSSSTTTTFSKPRNISTMIPAVTRVQLTLLDYTPKQIDAMTPIQANAILSSASSSSSPSIEKEKTMAIKDDQNLQQQNEDLSFVVSSSSSPAVEKEDNGNHKDKHQSIEIMTPFVPPSSPSARSGPVGIIDMQAKSKFAY
ncbi:hypothetical protein BGZ49_008938 [Haplosporangium sp. Z 27]|nr:hypothetical protein BGZ49_008938 [Haplosporangium sp. Z 27]